VSGVKQYKELVFSIAVLVGIIGAIAAYLSFVDDPIPEIPSIFENVNVNNVLLLLMLVPVAFAKWVLFVVEFLRIWWIVILCGTAPVCIVSVFYRIFGVTSKSKS